MSFRRSALPLTILGVLSLGGGRVLAGQGLTRAAPEEVGISSGGLEQVRAIVSRRIEEGKLAGAVALLARDGKVVFFEGFGMRNRRRRDRMRTDDIFRIASMTKPITSMAVMMLYEAGLVDLHTPVSTYLPDLAHLTVGVDSVTPAGDSILVTVPLEREPTVHDLLLHTAGFSYGREGTLVDARYRETDLRASETLADLVRRLGTIPLYFQPGSTWMYGYSTDVLARLVEVVSGQPLDEFFDERIFTPLGMDDTGFWVERKKLRRVAEYYRWDGERLSPAEARAVDRRPSFLSGGGGLLSTAVDYARFAQMFLNRGELDGARLLEPETVDLMTRNHLEPGTNEPLPGYGWGYGFAVRVAPARALLPGSVGEYDWGGGTGTGFWIDPRQGLIGVYMTQIQPLVAYRGEFRGVAYQALREIR